ncbi:DUF1127 domain-containing protein [Yoonia sp. GPGPB17]|uniref:DUF1127 domain-containing protein n=1 Tax=Yoonia sp. GPGPB17 TaxID=3026147 RepID=UPI0030C00E3B
MSLRPDNTLISNREMLLELLSVPFRALGSALQTIASNTARAQALRELAMISDEELKARGTTRAEVISMTFRHDG